MKDARPPSSRPQVLLVILIAVAALLFAGYFSPAPFSGDPSLLASRPGVEVRRLATGLAFVPASPAGAGLILYPGSRIKPESFAYLGQALAEKGHLVVLARFPLDFPVFASKRAREIAASFPELRTWYLAGHGEGAAAAATWLRDHPGDATGLVLLGGLPQEDDSLAATGLRVLCLSASLDGILGPERVRAAQYLLPESTRSVVIEGGNHGNFGQYGEAPGDRPATLDAARQRAIVVEEILAFIEG